MLSGRVSSQQATLRSQIGAKGSFGRPQGHCRSQFARESLTRVLRRSCTQSLVEAAATAHLADDHSVAQDDGNGAGNGNSSKQFVGGEQQTTRDGHYKDGVGEAGLLRIMQLELSMSTA